MSANAGTVPGVQASAQPIEGRVASRLRWFNLIVGLIHLGQAIALLVLSNDFKLPILGSFVDGPPGTAPSDPGVIWNVPLGPAVALFLLFAAVDHLLMVVPGVERWYLENLREKVNRARWIEYSVSSSLMMVLIAMVTGIFEFTALVAIFAANAAMIFFGLVQEAVSKPGDKKIYWWPFIFGSIIGIAPWVAIAMQVVYTNQQATGDGIPGFVYGIIVSLFLFFNSFAINMVLQYKQVGPWRSYEFGERAYIICSLVAKTALAWQVFANTLV
jgi:hypothetical protein